MTLLDGVKPEYRAVLWSMVGAGPESTAGAQSVAADRALLELIPDIVMRVRADGRVLERRCPAGCKVCVSDSPTAHPTLAEWYSPDAEEMLMDAIASAIMTGEQARFATEIRGQWGARNVDVRVARSSATEALVVLRDVTEVWQAQDTIRRQQAAILSAAKLSALGEMAAGIAHEINNPLSVINGRAEMLEMAATRGELLPEEIGKNARRIQATASRIAKIVKSLRVLARDAEHEPFEAADIRGIVTDVVELCAEGFRSHHVDFFIDWRCGDPDSQATLIECRPVQIGQVLLNLLSNAYDAVEKLEQKWIVLAVEDGGDDIRISITDSGEGIPAEVRDRILEPFFTTKPAGKGLGLGLSMSRAFVNGHGGSISVDPSSRNTCFIVTLPKVQQRRYDVQNAK